MSFETRKENYTPGQPYTISGGLLNKIARDANAAANSRSPGATNAVRLSTLNANAPPRIMEFAEAVVVNALEVCSLDPQSPAGARQAPCPSQHLYRIRVRSYNYTENKWVDEPKIQDMDAGALFEGVTAPQVDPNDPLEYSTQASQGEPSGPRYGPIPRFQVGDTLTVRYDPGRGAWLPVMPPVPDVTTYCFEVDDPGDSGGQSLVKFAEEETDPVSSVSSVSSESSGTGEDTKPKFVAAAVIVESLEEESGSSGSDESSQSSGSSGAGSGPMKQWGACWQGLDGGLRGAQTLSFHGYAIVKRGDILKVRIGKSDGINQEVLLVHARLSVQFNFRIGQGDAARVPVVTEIPDLGEFISWGRDTINRKGRFADAPKLAVDGDDITVDFDDPKDEQTVRWECDITIEAEIPPATGGGTDVIWTGESGIPARTGNTPGKGLNVEVWTINDADQFEDTADRITVYNWSKVSVPERVYAPIGYIRNGKAQVLNADCVSDDEESSASSVSGA